MLNNTNYIDMITVLFCVSSLTHMIIHCNKETILFPTLFDCQKKGLLRQLEELEATSTLESGLTKDTVISYPDIQQFHSFRLPKLRVVRFDSRNRGCFCHTVIDMVRNYEKEIPSTVESFRGVLFSAESVEEEVSTTLEECDFTRTTEGRMRGRFDVMRLGVSVRGGSDGDGCEDDRRAS